MQILVRHSVTIDVGEGLPRAIQHLLLTPQSSGAQTVREWRIEAPGMDDAVGFIDAYGNRAHLSSQTKPEAKLVVSAGGTVETHDRSGVVGRLERDPVPALFRRVTPLTKPLAAIVSKFRASPKDGKERIALLHALMARVAEVVGGETQSQSQSQDGQSQTQGGAREAAVADYAHAFIGAARALAIPARYVTGYLAPGGEDGLSGMHAWAEAWDEGLGWIGFDALLGLCPTERHVRLACGLDASSVPAVRSVPSGGTPAIEVAVELAS